MSKTIKGYIQNLPIAGCECTLYLPPKYYVDDVHYPVVYINGEDNIHEIMEEVEYHFGVDCSEFIAISVMSQDWNEDFTPWAAPPLTKKSESFKGGAGSYLNFLSNTIKPFIDEHSRNQRMAKVGNCTREAALILEEQLEFKGNLILEWNDGGHFSEISNRFMRALLWLMS
jgi:Predicted hydrolase of the alpha/beta superfamily